MKRFLFYFAVLLGSVWLGLKVAASPGYVLVTYQHWAMETSLWIFVAMLTLLFAALYFVLRLYAGAVGVGTWVSRWREGRRQRKSRRLTQQGLRSLAEGRFGRAEKSLIKAVSDSDNPLINYLAAANAAQGQNNLTQRDAYLRQALLSSDNNYVAVGVTQAELQLDTKQLEQALATLEHLNSLVPNHPHVLNLLQRVYVELEDWDALLLILPNLWKRKVLPNEQLTQLERRAYLEKFVQALPRLAQDEVAAAWKRIPRHLQTDPQIVAAYTQVLLKHHQDAEAEKLLRKVLKKQWDDHLVRLYGRVKAPNPSKQLSTAEAWLANQGESSSLLICLGQLCLQNQLWGKARGFFESALSLEPSVAALRDLGKVYEELDDLELALNCYRQGIELASAS